MRMMLITIVIIIVIIIIIQSYLARSPTPTTGEQPSQETQTCNLSGTTTIVIIINVSIIKVMITSFMITSVFIINIIIIKIFWCIAKVTNH